jgi:hypothetical protein
MSVSYERCLEWMQDRCVHCDDEFTEDCADSGHERLLTDADFEWRICDRCKGDGTLGGYPGVYTAEDFYEDPDFAEDYHNYRRPCEDCEGTGKILELTEAAAKRPEVREWLNDWAETEAIYRMERAYGA